MTNFKCKFHSEVWHWFCLKILKYTILVSLQVHMTTITWNISGHHGFQHFCFLISGLVHSLVSNIWLAPPFVHYWSSFCWNFWGQYKSNLFDMPALTSVVLFRCHLNNSVSSTIFIKESISLAMNKLLLLYIIFTY